jgi:AcrR family transcriptional regulator
VPRRRLPAEQRKQQIAFTAQKMFIEAGRDSVSMQSIADTAGVNIALLYRHFRSNVELYQAAVIEPLVVAIQEAVSTNRDDWPADAESRFTLVHQSIMEFVRTSGPLLRIALFSDGTSAREFYSEHIVPLLKNWVEPMLQEVADAGNLDLDIQATAVATFGAHLTFVLYPDASEDESASADIAGQLASLHWRGLSSR